MSAPSPQACVLVVDDDEDILESIRDALVDEGYLVAVARDGLDALEYLRREAAPSVVLLDWMMPRCDGSEFRRQQLQDPRLAEIPVVLLTADTNVHQKGAALGVADRLAKPVSLGDLLRVVATHCRPAKS